MKLSLGGAVLIYLMLASAIAAGLVALYLMPKRAHAIELLDRDGKALLVYDGASSPSGTVYYRDKGDTFVVYADEQIHIHPKADWFHIIIRR